MVSGGAAYNQLKRTQDTLSGDIQYWSERDEARTQREQLKKEKQAAAKQADRDAWEKSWALNVDDFQNQYTGATNYDDVGRGFANSTIQKYLEVKNQALNASPAERRVLEARLSKIKNAFAQFKSSQESYAKNVETYKKMADEGKISNVDSERYIDLLDQSFLKYNVVPRLDENDNLVYVRKLDKLENAFSDKTHIFKDSNGNDAFFEILPDSDIRSGGILPYQKQDIEGEVKTLVDALPSKGNSETTINGVTSIKKVRMTSEQQSMVEGAIDSMLVNDGVAADLAQQLNLNPNNLRKVSDDVKSQVRDKMLEKVKGKYETTEEDIDTSLANYRLNQAREARLRAKDEEKKQDSLSDKIIVKKSPATGKILKSPDYNLYENPISNEKSVVEFALKEPISLGVGDKETKVNSLSKTSNGEIVFSGEAKDQYSGEWETITFGGLNESELGDVAARLGVDAYELSQELDKLVSDKERKQSTSKEDLRKKYNY